MDRRFFLKVTGGAAAVLAGGLPRAAAHAEPELLPPGLYQFNGRVRLEAPFVEISGISNAQQISWSGFESITTSFSSYEEFSAPWRMPEVRVTGGRLESLAVVPVSFV